MCVVCYLPATSLLVTLLIAQGAVRQPGERTSLAATIRALADPSPAAREMAFRKLRALGSTASPAATVLVRILEEGDADQKSQARETLIAVGPQATTAVAKALISKNTEARRAAAFILGQFEDKARTAVPALVRALSDPDMVTQCNVIDALGSIGDPVAVAPLARLLRTNPHGVVRERAATALCAFGPRAKAAMPALLGALGNSGPDFDAAAAADAAASALASIGADAVAPLARLAGDRKRLPDERGLAIAALSRMADRKVLSAIPTLTAVLGDKNATLRYEAARALEKLGPAASASTGRLRCALRDTDASVRIAAASALLAISRDEEGAVVTLVTALRDKNPDVRMSAADTLLVFAQRAHKAMPALIIALRDPTADIRIAAASALGAMGARARPATAALERAKCDPEPFVRSAARQALQRIQAAPRADSPSGRHAPRQSGRPTGRWPGLQAFGVADVQQLRRQ